MKNLLISLSLLVCFAAFSQVKQSQPNFDNEYIVETIDNDINNSSKYMQDFLSRVIGLSQDGDVVYNMDMGKGTITYTYIKSVIHVKESINKDDYLVKLVYHVESDENSLIVKSLDISGSFELVANIFINYFPTTLNLEQLEYKQEITSYYVNDRAVFSSTTADGKLKAKISVRRNG